MTALIIGFTLSMATMIYIAYTLINLDMDTKKH